MIVTLQTQRVQTLEQVHRVAAGEEPVQFEVLGRASAGGKPALPGSRALDNPRAPEMPLYPDMSFVRIAPGKAW